MTWSNKTHSYVTCNMQFRACLQNKSGLYIQMNTIHVCMHACPAHWGWPACPSILHSVPPLSHFREGGERGEQFSLDRRTGSGETDTRLEQLSPEKKKKTLTTFGSADWQVIAVCFVFFKRGMNLLSLEVVCTITGFEEAVRRGGGWEHTAAAAAAAAAPNSQCARSELRQGDNTDPRAHWGAATSHLGSLFSFQKKKKPLPDWRFHPSSTADLLIDWDKIDFATRASGLISKLSHDVSGEIPKGQGDSGRIWNSS